MQQGQNEATVKTDADLHPRLDAIESSASRLKVYLFNVGQGDHILLELPNGEYGIIDFYYEGTLNLKEPPALTYLDNVMLETKKPVTLAFVCISHPDYDHVKGVDSFLKWARDKGVSINNFWLPPGKEIGELCERYEIALKKYAKNESQKDWGFEYKQRLEGIKTYLRESSGTVRRDYLQGAIRSLNKNLGGIEVVLIAPLTRHMEEFDTALLDDFFRLLIQKTKGSSAKNNLMSSVLLMVLNQHRLLFGGDADLDIWLDCLDEFELTQQAEYYGPCIGNFIKASHHGSKNSSSVELWNRILSERTEVGISAGKGKGHPDEQTLRDIHAAARHKNSRAKVLSTNTCTECLINETIPPEDVDHLKYARPDYPDEVGKALWISRSLSAGVRRQEKDQALGCYIFRLAINDPKVKVTKGLLPAGYDAVACMYPDSPHKPFPKCAD